MSFVKAMTGRCISWTGARMSFAEAVKTSLRSRLRLSCCSIPDVDGCVVCAVPDEMRGDEVFSFVINKKGASERDIFDHCMAHLTYFKVPGYIAFVTELPLTASQKVSRGEIKQMARKRLASKRLCRSQGIQKKKKSLVGKSSYKRSGYEGVVVTAPVSVPYERYSPEPAHWWLAKALSELGKASGLGAADVDGLCVSSFTLFPDTAAGLTQHFGLTPRWLGPCTDGRSVRRRHITSCRTSRAVRRRECRCLSSPAIPIMLILFEQC